MSRTTEKNYLQWIIRYFRFHNGLDPGTKGIAEYLSYLADIKNVAASTQNQALNVLIFLYREVLRVNPGTLNGISWARRPKTLPVALSTKEVRAVLNNLSGTQKLIAGLLYGTGMRLAEALRLRVKDLDFERNLVLVRDTKGNTDRSVPLPGSLKSALQRQVEKAKQLHSLDLQEGYGAVYLPFALDRKYPNANKQWCWQYVFPSHKRSTDPRTGRIGRHHLYDSIMQEAMAKAVRAAGLAKKVNCHTLRHSAATHWLEHGVDVRTVQDLLGHSNLNTTTVDLHVCKERALKVPSPLDNLCKDQKDTTVPKHQLRAGENRPPANESRFQTEAADTTKAVRLSTPSLAATMDLAAPVSRAKSHSLVPRLPLLQLFTWCRNCWVTLRCKAGSERGFQTTKDTIGRRKIDK
jgi:integron integrase